jgi:hypothetical protein
VLMGEHEWDVRPRSWSIRHPGDRCRRGGWRAGVSGRAALHRVRSGELCRGF